MASNIAAKLNKIIILNVSYYYCKNGQKIIDKNRKILFSYVKNIDKPCCKWRIIETFPMKEKCLENILYQATGKLVWHNE